MQLLYPVRPIVGGGAENGNLRVDGGVLHNADGNIFSTGIVKEISVSIIAGGLQERFYGRRSAVRLLSAVLSGVGFAAGTAVVLVIAAVGIVFVLVVVAAVGIAFVVVAAGRILLVLFVPFLLVL